MRADIVATTGTCVDAQVEVAIVVALVVVVVLTVLLTPARGVGNGSGVGVGGDGAATSSLGAVVCGGRRRGGRNSLTRACTRAHAQREREAHTGCASGVVAYSVVA